MSRRLSPAEKLRHHRQVFELAMQMKCSLKTAEATLAMREAALRHLAAMQRLQAKLNAPLPNPNLLARQAPDAPDFWWKRY